MYQQLNRLTKAVLLIGVTASPLAFAQLSDATWDKPYASGFGSYLWADVGYNDNVTHHNKDEDNVGSSYTQVGAGIQYLYGNASKSYVRARYLPTLGYYFSSEEDNFDDHHLNLAGQWMWDIRHTLLVDVSHKYLHEGRGTGLTAGLLNTADIDAPVEYTQSDIDLRYIFGSKGAKGQIIAGAKLVDREYSNFRSLEVNGTQLGTKFNDYLSIQGYARFAARIYPSLRWHLFANHEDKTYSYLAPTGNSKDNQVNTFNTGVLWEISGKTQGEASIGYQQKKFDSSQREDFSGLNWKIKGTWAPRSDSLLSLSTSQSAEDPDQFGDYVNERTLSLAWQEAWTAKVQSAIETTWEQDDYTADSSSLEDREDDILKITLKLKYQFQPRIHFSPYLSWEEKTSTWEEVEFSQKVVGIRTSIAL